MFEFIRDISRLTREVVSLQVAVDRLNDKIRVLEAPIPVEDSEWIAAPNYLGLNHLIRPTLPVPPRQLLDMISRDYVVTGTSTNTFPMHLTRKKES